MTDSTQHVIAFYARHPISAGHILKTLEVSRGHLRDVRPDELWAHDQDHYGGLAANDALAERAALAPGMRVADFCAGLGGPARYMAARYGVGVTGVELTPERVAGANALTRLVGLEERVRVVAGDVTDVPLDSDAFDAVLSQEALLHVAEKGAAVREAYRVLRRGGRLSFTDWILHRPLSGAEAEVMWNGIAAQTVQSKDSYRAMLTTTGFTSITTDDLTSDWAVILDERRRMYAALRSETLAAGAPSGDDRFYEAYVRLVELVQTRALGGARLTAVKN